MCTTASRALAALSLAALASLSGCFEAEDDVDTGTVNINLIGQGTSGAVYRLRDATITVEGPAPTVWHTEDDPDRTALSANVVPGSYSATVAPGWRLERVLPGMPAVDVTATLTSPNPFPFTVAPQERTSVPLRFAVEGDVVDMTSGYDITIGVDDLGTNLVVSASALTLLEGTTAAIGVRLATAPSAPVTVTVSSSDASALASTPTTLTFTPANFATAQNVTLFAVPDADVAGEMVIVSLGAMGLPTANVSVFVQDVDVQTILPGVTNLSLVEGGAGTFTVRLAAQPPANVIVTVASSDTSAVTAAPAALTFTPANYNTAQVVTLSGVADADAANEAVTVVLSSPGVAAATLTVTVSDDDVQSIVVTTPSVVLVEGGTATFGVRLGAQPASPISVQLVSSDTSAAHVTPATLTFTPGNWSSNQNVTVVAPQDADGVDEDILVQAISPGLATRTVEVNVVDNDAP
ncbi:MAG TPA: hypothetical protein VM261_34605 [Kofleriaceae bacterium]|nr:hypothetical protein [Kofleriaceae bacterium]